VHLAGSEASYDQDADWYELPGDMKLMDLNRLTNLGLEDARMTTIGGVILRILDRLPEVGDQVSINGTSLEVLEMEGNRVARVGIRRASGSVEVVS
jgi:putative hemolysin